MEPQVRVGDIVIYRSKRDQIDQPVTEMPAIVTAGTDDSAYVHLTLFPAPGQAAENLDHQWGTEHGDGPGQWQTRRRWMVSTLLDQFEDAIVKNAQVLDEAHSPDAALRLADWVISELRDGIYRLDPDPEPGDDVEYEIHARQPNGVRLRTVIRRSELSGLDDKQRIESIGLKAVALLTLLEAKKGHGRPLGQLEPPEQEQSISDYAHEQFNPDLFPVDEGPLA